LSNNSLLRSLPLRQILWELKNTKTDTWLPKLRDNKRAGPLP